MAHLNITLDQGEILALLSVDHDGAFRKLLQECLNKVLLAESTEQRSAEPYERSEERKDSRNGSRERALNLRVGTIMLTVPRHRNIPFKTMLFENYARSEATLVAGMAEMVINGVFLPEKTRKLWKNFAEQAFPILQSPISVKTFQKMQKHSGIVRSTARILS